MMRLSVALCEQVQDHFSNRRWLFQPISVSPLLHNSYILDHHFQAVYYHIVHCAARPPRLSSTAEARSSCCYANACLLLNDHGRGDVVLLFQHRNALVFVQVRLRVLYLYHLEIGVRLYETEAQCKDTGPLRTVGKAEAGKQEKKLRHNNLPMNVLSGPHQQCQQCSTVD